MTCDAIEETDISHTEGGIHVVDRLLRSLLMNEVGQGSRHILLLCFTDLFFAEIYNSRQRLSLLATMKRKQKPKLGGTCG